MTYCIYTDEGDISRVISFLKERAKTLRSVEINMGEEGINDAMIQVGYEYGPDEDDNHYGYVEIRAGDIVFADSRTGIIYSIPDDLVIYRGEGK